MAQGLGGWVNSVSHVIARGPAHVRLPAGTLALLVADERKCPVAAWSKDRHHGPTGEDMLVRVLGCTLAQDLVSSKSYPGSRRHRPGGNRIPGGSPQGPSSRRLVMR